MKGKDSMRSALSAVNVLFFDIISKIYNNQLYQVIFFFWIMDKKGEDASTKELNAFVQNMLKQMQDRFEEMSGNIVGRVD